MHQAAGDLGIARVLAQAGESRSAVDLQRPGGWSSYRQGLALFRAASEVLGDPKVGYKAGTEVFRQYAGTEVLAILRSIRSPAEMLRVYPEISAKQSTITRAEVMQVGETFGLISVFTPDHKRDPLFCGYTAGALSQFPVLFGMDPAEVEELECQASGDSRCLIRVSWDPTSSSTASLEHELELLKEQIEVLTKRFQSLESVASELASTRDVNSMLETITRRAGVAVRAPRYLLVAQLPGETNPRIHHVGFTELEARTAAEDVLRGDPDEGDRSRLVVDIRSARGHLGRLAAFYPRQYHFLAQERSLLMAYAGHAAAALETAAILDESRERNTTLSALLALGRELAEESTRAEIAGRLVDAVPEIVGYDVAHVLLWDADDLLLTRVASRGSPLEPVSPSTAIHDDKLADLLLNLSTPVLVSSASALSSILMVTSLDSGVVTPITARNTLVGALVVGSNAGDVPLDDTLIERLTGVAGLAARALDGVFLLEEVRHQALHDSLTDLPNPRLFEDRVTQALAIASRHKTRLAVLFLDLDGFKAVNDAHGHKVGDQLLRGVAQRLLETVREEDTVARLGGDEFGILIQGASTTGDAEGAARRIASALCRSFVVDDLILSTGASVGLTMFPELGDTYDSVISRADAEMYRAKAASRGRTRAKF